MYFVTVYVKIKCIIFLSLLINRFFFITHTNMSVEATTRPEYRDTKKPTSVCVYTIAQESRYLIIENIPIYGNSIEDFIKFCGQFGQVNEYRMLDTHASSSSTADVVWIQYASIQEARYAKRKMDDKSFNYNLLRVNYAPEYETPKDIRIKFQDRFQAVHTRLNNNNSKRKKWGEQPTRNNEKQTKKKQNIYGPLEREYHSENKTINDDNEISSTNPNKRQRRRI
jgi:hypothetical protein